MHHTADVRHARGVVETRNQIKYWCTAQHHSDTQGHVKCSARCSRISVTGKQQQEQAVRMN